MEYILTAAEFEELRKKATNHDVAVQQSRIDRDIADDLRAIVFTKSGFKCFHDLSEKERETTYVDEGYCDDCPLSFTENETKKMKWNLCPHKNHLYSK